MSAGDIPSTDDLRELGEGVAELTRKLGKTPGLSEGHVERIATAIERILRDYGGASYRQYRNLVRDLDVIAADVSRLGKEKALHPRFVRYLDASLLRIRKRDLRVIRRRRRRTGGAYQPTRPPWGGPAVERGSRAGIQGRKGPSVYYSIYTIML